MTRYCKYCKFCEKRLLTYKITDDIDDAEERYFCKFMPKEIETEEFNWCGQFKRDIENGRDPNVQWN